MRGVGLTFGRAATAAARVAVTFAVRVRATPACRVAVVVAPAAVTTMARKAEAKVFMVGGSFRAWT